MADQADQLRKLVQEATHQSAPTRDIPLVVVCGGQRRAGGSTVALQLALAWQQQKHKPVLVDASFHEPSFYAQWRGKRYDTLVDVFSGGRTVAEALHAGPHGLSVLSSAELPPALAEVSAKTWGKIIGQLRSLQASADVILFDVGAGAAAERAALWRAADYVLLVTRSEPISVTDTYATLKIAGQRMGLPPVGVVANQVGDESESLAASARIASAAARFLNLGVDVLPPIPWTSELAEQTAATSRLHKDSAVKAAWAAVAERVWQRLQERSTSQSSQAAAA